MGGEQCCHDRGVDGRVAGGEEGHDEKLGRGHDDARDSAGAVRTETGRQRAEAHLTIALDRLEVVQRHDPVSA